MINSKDLRIGNYVWGVSDRIEIIKEIHYKGGLWTQPHKMDFQSVSNCEDISGIILTPEILEKCGFASLPHFTVMDSRILDVGRGRKLSIGCVGTPNEMLFLTDEEDGKTDNIIVLHNWDYDGPLYLHKLQNTISIFNTELTINL